MNNMDEEIPVLLEKDDGLEMTINPLDKFRTNASETALMSHQPSDKEIDNEIISIAPGQGKKPVSILHDDNCEALAHPHLLPKGRFGYKDYREVPLSASKYFNQSLLNYTRKFEFVFVNTLMTLKIKNSGKIRDAFSYPLNNLSTKH